ncbi:MAG: shikimate kinase [Deltaproteobacteria bacterium]|jgi:shikimate kinase|nr:shikimate kinase [Deltaproteobacteria bacterium]
MASDRIRPSGQLQGCISLIGMAGAGKSTVGRQLARLLDWKLMDTDQLIEAAYGVPLQDITDKLGKEAFLDVEATVICAIKAHRIVLATGGSVVYREDAMAHLRSMGPIAYLDVPLPVILERIARNPLRGLAVAPGQSVEDLFRERETLYARYADYTLDAGGLPPEVCATAILQHFNAET